MDPTFAAFLGTVFGASITAFVPAALHRNARREIERESRRKQTAMLLEVLLRLIRTRQLNDTEGYLSTHSEAVVALEQLLLLANKRDALEIERVAGFALTATSNWDKTQAISAGVEAMSQVLRRWCRGELKGSQIGDAYTLAFESRLYTRVTK